MLWWGVPHCASKPVKWCIKARATVLANQAAQAGLPVHHQRLAINTGDGVGMALRAGVRCRTWKCGTHPTGIAGAGVLVTEGRRGEGGYLLNKHGERFYGMRRTPKTGGS